MRISCCWPSTAAAAAWSAEAMVGNGIGIGIGMFAIRYAAGFWIWILDVWLSAEKCWREDKTEGQTFQRYFLLPDWRAIARHYLSRSYSLHVAVLSMMCDVRRSRG